MQVAGDSLRELVSKLCLACCEQGFKPRAIVSDLHPDVWRSSRRVYKIDPLSLPEAGLTLAVTRDDRKDDQEG